MTPPPPDTHNSLIAEQLAHTLDLIRAELSTIKNEQAHQAEMNSLRLKSLECQAVDYEKRLRELTESATQFKLLVSLSVSGGLLSIITLLRSLLYP